MNKIVGLNLHQLGRWAIASVVVIAVAGSYLWYQSWKTEQGYIEIAENLNIPEGQGDEDFGEFVTMRVVCDFFPLGMEEEAIYTTIDSLGATETFVAETREDYFALDVEFSGGAEILTKLNDLYLGIEGGRLTSKSFRYISDSIAITCPGD